MVGERTADSIRESCAEVHGCIVVATIDSVFIPFQLARAKSGTMPLVDVHTLAVPWSECVSFTPGQIPVGSLDAIRRNGFDDAPVWDGTAALGIVRTEVLERLHAAGDDLAIADIDADDIRFLEVEERECIDIARMLHVLGQARSVVLVRSDSNAKQPLGFITVSDLNRQGVRAVIYEILASLETELAFVVQHVFPEPWDWVRFLNEDSQVRVLGYWELAKRRGVDVGPIAAATLTQLLQVGMQSSLLLDKLGYTKRTALQQDGGRLPELRNRVMHPVRPLVLSTHDATAMAKALDSAMHLAAKVKKAAGDLRLWQPA